MGSSLAARNDSLSFLTSSLPRDSTSADTTGCKRDLQTPAFDPRSLLEGPLLCPNPVLPDSCETCVVGCCKHTCKPGTCTGRQAEPIHKLRLSLRLGSFGCIPPRQRTNGPPAWLHQLAPLCSQQTSSRCVGGARAARLPYPSVALHSHDRAVVLGTHLQEVNFDVSWSVAVNITKQISSPF